jgi:hypothetical protein
MSAINVSSAPGRLLRMAAVAAFAAFTLTVPTTFAQTPIADSAASHPAHIHAGTCAELGDVVFPLENLVDLAATGEVVGSDSAIMTVTSRTVVDATLDDILAGEHAVNIHLSDDEIGTYIACGNIGGVLAPSEADGPGLVIGLGELNDSGWAGVAWLGDVGGQTEVVVTLIQFHAAT